MIQTQETTSLVPVCRFPAHNTYITRVLLSPDVRHLATCSADHTARIWTVDMTLAMGGFAAPASPVEDASDSGDDSGSGGSNESYDGDGEDDDVDGEGSAGSADAEEVDKAATRRLQEAHKARGTNTNTSLAYQHTHALQPALGSQFAGPPAPPAFPPANGVLSVTTTNGTTTNGTHANANNPGFVCTTVLEGHQRWVWDCAFSADSAYLVTACSDHYARLWELSSKSIIRQYNGHHRGAVCVALNDYSEVR